MEKHDAVAAGSAGNPLGTVGRRAPASIAGMVAFAGAVLTAALAAGAQGRQGAAFGFEPRSEDSASYSLESDDGGVVGFQDVTGDRLDDMLEFKRTGERWSLAVYPQLTWSHMEVGTLAPPVTIPLGGDGFVWTSATGDFNGDGINDIAVGTGYRVDVILADGQGGFLPPRRYADDHLSTVEAVADFDNDGRLDVLSTGNYENSILFGDGLGSFRSRKAMPNPEYRRDRKLLFADVSGDGISDIVALSRSDSWQFAVARGDGRGSFRARTYYRLDGFTNFEDVAIGDTDGDGRNEVLLANAAGDAESHGVLVFSQNASGDLAHTGSLSDRTEEWPTGEGEGPHQLVTRDLDRDGRTDLVAVLGAGVGYYLQGPAGLAEEPTPVRPTVEDPVDRVALGTIGADGCTDLMQTLYHPELQGYLDLHVSDGVGCDVPRVSSDFDGDGKSDLLWHHAATGASAIWRSADVTAQRAVTQVTDTAWKPVGIGDFDGDGRADIVWRNAATGAGTIWKSGDSRTQRALTRVTDPAWAIAGIGDFDADGRSDLLWRNSATGNNVIWKRGEYGMQRPVRGVSDVRWTVAGVGDFDGDGRDDVFWRHGVSGANVIWLGADHGSQQPVAAVTGMGWLVAGIGDFDGDGGDDVFWRLGDGRNAIWRSGMHSRRLYVSQQPAPRWTFAGVGDYDGNGKADVLWRRDSDGRNVMWKAAALSVPQAIATVSDTRWQVVR